MLLAAGNIKIDTKLKLFMASLEGVFKLLKKAGANRKAVIFTESRETQNYLEENLKDLYKISIYNGSKDYRAIDNFKSDCELIISTDQGARGFNFEESSLVINYDLLYNTLKMEQRIDRCHRLNQQNDVIVLNFLNKSNMLKKVSEVSKDKNISDGVTSFVKTYAEVTGKTHLLPQSSELPKTGSD